MRRPWRQGQIDVLTALWAQGWPASEIGETLHKSRHAVLGKLDRLGLLGALSPEQRRERHLRGMQGFWTEAEKQKQSRSMKARWRAKRMKAREPWRQTSASIAITTLKP